MRLSATLKRETSIGAIVVMVVTICVGVMALSTTGFFVLKWAVGLATAPLAAKVDSTFTNTSRRLDAETGARASGDSLIGLQISTLGRVIVTPDSLSRALLMERVEELRPKGRTP